jgi:hypothetical protein
VPKLFINADPGAVLTGRPRELCRTWPHQTEVTIAGRHFVQEDSPNQIGQAIRQFVQHNLQRDNRGELSERSCVCECPVVEGTRRSTEQATHGVIDV